jgi:ferric-dicitrate binding protein FerR (iron transport regulator)
VTEPGRRALLALPLLAAGLHAAAAASRPRVGEVTTVTGTALAHYGLQPPRALHAAAEILLEDMLATDPGARLACRLATGIELRLGGNATLRVDSIALRGRRPAGVALSSLSGPLLFDRPPPSGGVPPAPPPPVSLDLPWARIGVRGTRFFAGPLDDVFAVFCARGAVRVTLPGGGRADLTEGEGVDVPRGPAAAAPPALEVRRWGAARIARALAVVE